MKRILDLWTERIWFFIAELVLESLYKGTWKKDVPTLVQLLQRGWCADRGCESHLEKAEQWSTLIWTRCTLQVNYILEIALLLTVAKPHANYFVFHLIIKEDSFHANVPLDFGFRVMLACLSVLLGVILSSVIGTIPHLLKQGCTMLSSKQTQKHG